MVLSSVYVLTTLAVAILHRHCHDKKTASDGSLVGIHDKNHIIEEPYEVKVSRTVLQTSRLGD